MIAGHLEPLENPLRAWLTRHLDVTLRQVAVGCDVGEALVPKWVKADADGQGSLPLQHLEALARFTRRVAPADPVRAADWRPLQEARRDRRLREHRRRRA